MNTTMKVTYKNGVLEVTNKETGCWIRAKVATVEGEKKASIVTEKVCGEGPSKENQYAGYTVTAIKRAADIMPKNLKLEVKLERLSNMLGELAGSTSFRHLSNNFRRAIMSSLPNADIKQFFFEGAKFDESGVWVPTAAKAAKAEAPAPAPKAKAKVKAEAPATKTKKAKAEPVAEAPKAKKPRAKKAAPAKLKETAEGVSVEAITPAEDVPVVEAAVEAGELTAAE